MMLVVPVINKRVNFAAFYLNLFSLQQLVIQPGSHIIFAAHLALGAVHVELERVELSAVPRFHLCVYIQPATLAPQLLI